MLTLEPQRQRTIERRKLMQTVAKTETQTQIAACGGLRHCHRKP